ncbi:MAG: hypothetical protein M3540_02985 [Actinomycetota bacterium]|nr:hypothetical protein [Actinomycetota bacterium]
MARDQHFQGSLDDFDTIRTNKCNVHIPLALYKHRDLKLLIIDDLALGGDTLVAMRDHCIAHGFQADSVKTMSLVATEVAIRNRKAPDFFWKETDSPRFYFPWGEAR